MDFYFVSDDNYFVLGVGSFLGKISNFDKKICVNVKENLSGFTPSPGDVVVFAIADYKMLRMMMKWNRLTEYRLIIMLKLSVSIRPLMEVTPKIIPWDISLPKFIRILHEVAKKEIRWICTSERVTDICLQLGLGRSLSEVATQFSLSEKYVYAMRRNVFAKLGLNNCNSALGTLICRDILEVRLRYSHEEFKRTGRVTTVRYLSDYSRFADIIHTRELYN
ncbi:helix-turn-helix transcriptional regulator [Klebsiella oxytoca]|uniref:helix-turn-helix transcriptional regulator n=1 Tax=Klebsiella oxytoca TaxID=571 RepID=UPI001B32F0F6|nr:hypothetical protein [Klebsiella oxytoca]EJM1003851.1 hypothetical protein [Klebsiella oxytoca]EKQ7238930.1 hypothetical protein [Klebsiella oxytoca]WBD78242.1 hypothetical protein OEE41_03955 [Klebsiella oxytoca]HBC8616423.1 hypothetical protein [Klebsiella oxytoca]